MYSERHVLHRDISVGNVMVTDRDRTVASSRLAKANESNESSYQHKFCFVEHLLDPL